MHFDQRTQQALRAVGLDTDDLRAASDAVVEAVEEDAGTLEAFFDEHDTVYSDIDMAHSASDYPEHTVEFIDITTHAAEMRGWLRFDTWGVYVEDGRVLDAESEYVELTLGPTINDRVRFAADRETLR
ncbi:hypothetical protein [Natrialba sp. PRR66]|uniref:DUF7532 family protein n=1 Tax=Natrialba sp. PRR66 TaxID=3098146 RepID=UPI002B1DAE3F|nr:hypothetical protein [Natrialba sp. PRR66]